jgi:hypothetical protein
MRDLEIGSHITGTVICRRKRTGYTSNNTPNYTKHIFRIFFTLHNMIDKDVRCFILLLVFRFYEGDTGLFVGASGMDCRK